MRGDCRLGRRAPLHGEGVARTFDKLGDTSDLRLPCDSLQSRFGHLGPGTSEILNLGTALGGASMIQLRLLGSVGLTGPAGEELPAVLRQPKRLALLAYLAVALPRGYHRRDTLLMSVTLLS